MKADFEKVKRVYEKLKEIEKDCGYREVEVAYLILERLDNIIDDEVDITEEIVDMYNAMLAKQPVYIDIEKDLDYDVRANHGKICTGILKLKTTVKIVELSKEDMSSLPWTWNAREKKRILLEHEFASKINFKRKAYSMESEKEIRDKRQQWNYASRYGRK